jgi:hypothetical protein
MKPFLAAALAIAFLFPSGAHAGDPEPELFWAPRYLGKFGDYFPNTQTDVLTVVPKMGRIARRCPALNVRGPRLTVKKQKPPAPAVTSGFFQLFGDANQKRDPATVTFVLDPTGLGNAGSRIAVELDSPFVPIGGDFDFFTIFALTRQKDDTLRASVFVPGMPVAVEVGDPLSLPADTPGVIGEMTFDSGLVDVVAKSCTDPAAPAIVATDVPLAFGGSSGVGAGITGQKGDSGGFHIAVSGDLYEGAKREILEDLQAIIDLELAAAQDLANAMPAAAREKIEAARVAIEDHGAEIPPPTKPPTFEPSLNQKIQDGLPEGDVKDEVQKRVGKAGTRDAKARDAIDAGKPDKAVKELDKANQDKQRAKAVLETGVRAEARAKF